MKWTFTLTHLKHSLKRMFSRQRIYFWVSGKNYPTLSEFLRIFSQIRRNPASCFIPDCSSEFKNFPVSNDILSLDFETAYYFDVGNQYTFSLTCLSRCLKIVFYEYDDFGSLVEYETIFLRVPGLD